MSILRIIAAFFLLLLSSLDVSGGDPDTGKLFTGVRYEYEFYSSTVPGDWLRWFAKWRTNSVPEEIFTGTFWATVSASTHEMIYVTAAHILQIGTLPISIEGHEVNPKTCRIINKTPRAYLGFLGYDVSYVGQIPDLHDVAFMRPRRSRMAQDLAPLPLSDTPPRVREQVSFFGFPSTAKQQVETAQVASVHEAQRYFVLNRSVDPGFSGGPVMNSYGQVYGVITSTDKANKQTTVMRLRTDMLPAIAWRPYPEDYLSK